MNPFTCAQVQHLLKSGVLLAAGVPLTVEDRHAVEAHLNECEACRRLESRITAFDMLLRDSLQARRSFVPAPSPALARRFRKRIEARRMANLWKAPAWGALGLLAILAIVLFWRMPETTSPAISTLNVEKIMQNPGDYMLRVEDLPEGALYYLPGELNTTGAPIPIRVSNEDFAAQIGQARAAQIIEDTGRVNGWANVSQRVEAEGPGPNTIRTWLWVHETEQGARRNVTDYAPGGSAFQQYEDWQPLGGIESLGDIAASARLVIDHGSNFRWVTYRVDFAFHQVSVRVELVEREGRIQLEDALQIAHRICERLQEVEETHERP